MANRQTAMQELMEWMIEESQVIPVDAEETYNKAKELLVREKEQMIEFADRYGFDVCHFDYDRADEYYEQTYRS